MGCASSTPLVESGKNLVEAAKESANDAVNMGEKAFHDAGDAAKEGMEHVKDSVHIALSSAEDTVGDMVGKLGETFNFHSNNAKDTIITDLETMKDDTLNNLSEGATEAVSEAETVLMSETENIKETITSSETAVMDTVESFTNGIENDLNETKENVGESIDAVTESIKSEVENGVNEVKENANETMEDVDQHLGDSVEEMEKKMEEVLESTKCSTPSKELEEMPPTFWEAAADAILLRKTIRTLDYQSKFDENNHTNEEYLNKENEGRKQNRSKNKMFITESDND